MGSSKSGAAAANVFLLALSVVAGLVAVQCANRPAPGTGARTAPQLCGSGAAQLSHRFGQVRGFITYSDGAEIWAVDPNQTANRISLGLSNGSSPIVWSQDGNRLLLRTAGINSFNGDLCVVNADGSHSWLTSDGQSGDGSFSPDGTKVVFERIDRGLFVVDAKGGSPRLIARSYGAWWLESPAWSPDGSRIAYMVYQEGGPEGLTYQIWTMNPDGTNPRPLVDLGECGGGGCSGGLAWSPDGSMLAFHSMRDNPSTRTRAVYVVRADGRALHLVNDGGFQPAWSPDGTRVAFFRLDPLYALVRLYTAAPDGSDARQVEGVVVVQRYGLGSPSVAWNPAA